MQNSISHIVGQSYASMRDIVMGGFLSRATSSGANPEQTQDMNNALVNIDIAGLLKSAKFVFTPNSYSEGKAYSQLPRNGNGDFTFSRATNTATKIAKDGTIQLSDPNTLLSPQWLDAVAGVGALAVAPSSFSFLFNNGTLVLGSMSSDGFQRLSFAAVADRFFIQQSIQVQSGITYVFSVNLDTTTNNLAPCQFFGEGSNINNTKTYYYQDGTNLGSGTNNVSTPGVYYMVYTPSGSGSIGVRFGVGTNGAATGTVTLSKPRLWSTTNNSFVPSGNFCFPRVDYSTGSACLLLEPNRTNNLYNSIWLGVTGAAAPTNWSFSFSTGSQAVVNSIYGSYDNSKAVQFSVAATRQCFAQGFTSVANTVYVFSIYVEAYSGSVPLSQVFGETSGLAGTVKTYYTDYGTSLTDGSSNIASTGRYYMVYSNTIGGVVQFRAGIGVSNAITGSVTLSRPMVESGLSGSAAYPTSFIPTITNAVTRGVESLTLTGLSASGLIGATSGTWFLDIRNNIPITRDGSFFGIGIGSSGAYAIRIFNGGSALSRLSLYINNNPSLTIVTNTLTKSIKLAIKWDGTNIYVSLNGAAVVSIPFGGTNFSGNDTITVNPADVPYYISCMALWNTPLSDADCQLITS